MTQLKINVINLEELIHSELQVAFIQFSHENSVGISKQNIRQKNVFKPTRDNRENGEG